MGAGITFEPGRVQHGIRTRALTLVVTACEGRPIEEIHPVM